jgi:hypothetical protein
MEKLVGIFIFKYLSKRVKNNKDAEIVMKGVLLKNIPA